MSCPLCEGNLVKNTIVTPRGQVMTHRCGPCEMSFVWIGETEVQVSIHDEGSTELDNVSEHVTSEDLFATAAVLTTLGASKDAETVNEWAHELAGKAEDRATPKYLRREYQPNFF